MIYMFLVVLNILVYFISFSLYAGNSIKKKRKEKRRRKFLGCDMDPTTLRTEKVLIEEYSVHPIYHRTKHKYTR